MEKARCYIGRCTYVNMKIIIMESNGVMISFYDVRTGP